MKMEKTKTRLASEINAKLIRVKFDYVGIAKKWNQDMYAFSYALKLNKTIIKIGSWYCGLGWKVGDVKAIDILHSVIMDCTCYLDSDKDLDEFLSMFGYEYSRENEKIFKECKATYEELSKYLTDEEMYFISDEENHSKLRVYKTN